jgi:hydroxyacylglutathione hydrolase
MSDSSGVRAHSVQVAQVSPHLWAIPLTFFLPTPTGAVAPRLVHAYTITGERESALVDCGTAACADDIVTSIGLAGLAPGGITRLVATHEHADHMGAALPLVQRFNWPVAAHVAARRWLEDAALQRQERPLPQFETLMAGSVHVDQPLEEGDELDLGECRLHVLYTPGHSRGSLSLILEPDGVVITGDALISAVAAPFYDDPAAVRATVGKLRGTLVGGRRAVSSHAPTPSLVSDQALDQTLDLVARMEAAVREARAELGTGDEDALVRRALDLAGWRHQAVMPLTRLTVRAHLAAG